MGQKNIGLRIIHISLLLLYFFAFLIFLLDFCVKDKAVIRFRFANRLRIVIFIDVIRSAVVFVFIVWMRVQVFIMRKNEMKNVFNVQTVEPNEQHILKCVLYKNEKEICWKKTDP